MGAMFKKKKRNSEETTEADAQKAVVGSGRSRWGRLKKILFVLGIIIVAGVIALLVVLQNRDDGDGSETDQTPIEHVRDAGINAQDAQLSNNLNEAYDIADEAIDYAEGDNEAQAQAYAIKATVAYKEGDYDTAMEAARQADELSQNSLAAALIAKIARAMGNLDLAAEYYQITIDRIKASDFPSQTDVEYYEGLLQAVKAEQA